MSHSGISRRGFLGTLGAGGLAAALPLGAKNIATPGMRPRPSLSQLAWQREELTMFVHFGMNTFSDREWGDGRESPSAFALSKLDARQWARAAKQAGFGSMILTAKHHDGFCLWPTATTRHSVAASPWRDGHGDVVREFTDACRAEGLRAGLYLSPWDRNHPTYGQGDAYNDIYIAQLTELLTHYGRLFELWFDGANGEGPDGRHQHYDWARIHATVRKLQPDAVMFSDAGPDLRWVGNEHGSAGATNWSTVDPARVSAPGANDPWTTEALQQGDPDGSVWRPAETDVSIRPGWFWHANESSKVRSPDNLLELYFSSVGRNSKLLLNVPPNRDGLIDAADLAVLSAFRARRDELFAHDLLRDARTVHRNDSLEFELAKPATFDVIRLQEDIAHGQHVAGYRLQAHDGSDWHTIHWGNTIGYTRLARIAPTTAQRLRLLIDFAYGSPRIARVALFRDPRTSGMRKRSDDHGDA
ncbi:alpha-L-fucosidase [Solilutibacter silvestris]|uniref:alpha-L-fucosidase n=1 Tax=Solilutibacter silvestris TaxID=1645665 RepID=A0A2K1Q102_9GAMM|nr:alpha-L-fucosidase [Lysobacter silvestris]PNS08713.1 Tat pathway signal peptide [Lysobacter silvestris]